MNMGVTIRAYPGVKYIERGDPEKETNGVAYFYPEESFIERMDGFDPGLYQYDPEDTKQISFSYSGYNLWRDMLARIIHGCSAAHIWDHKEVYVDTAFYELVDFSDCEGTIGPKTCEKLARDFKDHIGRVRAYVEEMEDSTVVRLPRPPSSREWLEQYEQFSAIFTLAANGAGFVKF